MRNPDCSRTSVPQRQIETEVLEGLEHVLGSCTDVRGFTRRVNEELTQIWAGATGFRPDAAEKIRAIERKISNVRRAIEDGLEDAAWANDRLRELSAERDSMTAISCRVGSPPQIDSVTALEYRKQAEKLFSQGGPEERKRLLRTWVQEVKLRADELEVVINYRLPESVMNGVVAGEGFEPSTFGL